MRHRLFAIMLGAVAVLTVPASASAQDVVRLGNLKFAHYGAVSYMKEIAEKYGLKSRSGSSPRAWTSCRPSSPARSTSARRGLGRPPSPAAPAARRSIVVAGFAKGGARLVAGKDSGIKTLADLKGKKVGVTRGGAQELLLLAELAKAGLTWSDKPGKDVQHRLPGLRRPQPGAAAKQIDAMCQSEPQSSQAINKGFGVEMLQALRHADRRADPRAGDDREAVQREARTSPQRVHAAASSRRRDTSSQDPTLAEKYVRETDVQGPDQRRGFPGRHRQRAPTPTTSRAEHIQITTDLMEKYGVGRMATPPRAADWVKLDLLARRRRPSRASE